MSSSSHLIAAMAALVSASVAIPSAPVSAETSSARVVAPVRDYEFGRVKQGEKISHCFDIGNSGGQALQIPGMSLSLPGMNARASASIAPGTTGRICIDLDTSALNLNVNARTVVSLNDPTEPQVAFTLHGYVSQPIDLIPMGAVFASVFQGEGAERHVTIINNEARPLEIRGVEKQGTHFQAKVAVKEPGRVFDLAVRIDPATPPGRYLEFAYLVTNNLGFSRIRIPINILVKRDLYAMPEAIDFGELNLAQLKASPQLAAGLTETFMVHKRAGNFRIERISSDVPGLDISMTPAGESQVFQIDVTPQPDRIARGTLSGTIRIATSDPAFPLIAISVHGEVK